jgi:uncharacterized protein YqgC (DUF456 family)
LAFADGDAASEGATEGAVDGAVLGAVLGAVELAAGELHAPMIMAAITPSVSSRIWLRNLISSS